MADEHRLQKLRAFYLPGLWSIVQDWPGVEGDIHIDYANDSLVFKIYRFPKDEVTEKLVRREVPEIVFHMGWDLVSLLAEMRQEMDKDLSLVEAN